VRVQAVAFEARELVQAVRDELDPAAVGPIVVSGMLAEQLARALAAGAEPGSVIVGSPGEAQSAAVVLHVIAGDPSSADDELVRAADRFGVPIVLVQLWPQADWTPPFVLSAFVVECRAGEGFPLDEIADRVAHAAVELAPALAARIPLIRDAVARTVLRRSMFRTALIALGSGRGGIARIVLAYELARMLARLRTTDGRSTHAASMPVVAGVAGAAVASSLALRVAARTAARSFTAPLVNAAVVVGTSWALGKAVRRVER
jgi:hypothetical protein